MTAGVTALFGLAGTKSLLGWRQEFDYDGPNPLRPGFYALVGDPATPADEVWVKDRRVHVGPTEATATPYRDCDFVLFSVANWTALVQAIGLSPDLTEPQKNAVIEVYWNKMNAMRTQAKGHDIRDENSPPDPLDALRARSLRSIA